jgi:hypothetical protein
VNKKLYQTENTVNIIEVHLVKNAHMENEKHGARSVVVVHYVVMEYEKLFVGTVMVQDIANMVLEKKDV